MTAPTREQVEALLALEAKVNRPGGARHLVEVHDFYDAARNHIRPLAEAYLATLDARRDAILEELELLSKQSILFLIENPKAITSPFALSGVIATRIAKLRGANPPVLGLPDPTLDARREGEREALRRERGDNASTDR